MNCPNCGSEADEVVANDEPVTTSGYDRICYIGSQSDTDLRGHRVVHL